MIFPRRATAVVSMRIVPDQSPKEIFDSFKQYMETVFQWKGTCNTLKVECLDQADWWLGDLNNLYYRAAEAAIKQVWDKKPHFIREGGTIPVTRFLEKVSFLFFSSFSPFNDSRFHLHQRFAAPAIHLPLGQHSDAAHLANERIRVTNLVQGSCVFSTFLQKICGQ